MASSDLDMRAFEKLLGRVGVGSVRVVAVFLVSVSAESRRLPYKVSQ